MRFGRIKRIKLRLLPCGLMLLAITQIAQSADFVAEIVDKAGKPVPDAVILVQTNEQSVAPNNNGVPENSIVDQKDKSFVPHVSVISPRTLVSFPNSDDTRHHVYSFSDAKTFELKLYRANDAPPVEFPKTGIVTLGCNIHDNMKAYLYVTDNPFHGVSDSSGMARVPYADSSLPLSLIVWHPQLEAALELTNQAPDSAGHIARITLPIDWQTPQQGKDAHELESLLKRFKR